MKTIVIATNNAGKAREYQEMLIKHDIVVKTLADFSQDFHINENGQTFEENALIKARTVMKQLNLPVVADDSGLMVDYLKGQPGVHSARYAGDHDDQANNAKLLHALQGVPMDQRTAHFHTTIVAVRPDSAPLISEGRVDGHILEHPQGQNGFGYDPLFYVDELQTGMAELSPEQKNTISHRGRALRQLMTKLPEWWS